MGLIDSIKKLFDGETADQPVLVSEYLILLDEQAIGRLNEPVIPDQFWIDFSLTPISEDEGDIDLLYSQAYWSSDMIKIIEEDSGREVEFLLSGQHYDVDDEPAVVPLESRPARITLRGPYAPES